MDNTFDFLPPEDMQFDYCMSALSETVDWGLLTSHIPDAHKITKGKGIKVAVLDTGCFDHVDLIDNIIDRQSVVPGESAMDSECYHGCHVSGIIAASENGVGIVGVAPESKIISIKVLGRGGRGNYQNIEDGIRLATQLGADIINMSLGTASAPPESLHQAIVDANNKGIIVVAAAGNDSGNVNYPACFSEVIAVAAIDENGSMAKFSSRGGQIKVGAPGTNIYSTFGNNQYAIMQGTSQASPFVSGICALLLSWSRNTENAPAIKNSQDMLQILDELCDPKGRIGFTGEDGDLGFGIPDFANFKPWKQ